MASRDLRQELAEVARKLALERVQVALERAEAEQQAQRQRRQSLARAHDSGLFKAAIGDIVPLAAVNRATPPAPRVAPRPLQAPPAAPSPGVSAFSAFSTFSDGPEGRSLDGTDQTPVFARSGIDRRTLRKLQRGEIAVGGQLDLHGLTRDGARDALSQFLRAAAESGWRCVCVVHGKGLGSTDQTPILKTLVRRWLVQAAQVLAYAEAGAADGGSGAVLVLLKTAAAQTAVHAGGRAAPALAPRRHR